MTTSTGGLEGGREGESGLRLRKWESVRPLSERWEAVGRAYFSLAVDGRRHMPAACLNQRLTWISLSPKIIPPSLFSLLAGKGYRLRLPLLPPYCTLSIYLSHTHPISLSLSLSFTFSVFLLYKFSVFSLLSSLLNLLSFYLFTWTNWRLLLYCFCFLIPTCQTFYYLQHVGFLFLYFALLLLLLPTKSQCFEPSFLVLFPMWIRYPVAAAAAVVVNTNESLFVENNFLPHKNPLVVFVPSYR